MGKWGADSFTGYSGFGPGELQDIIAEFPSTLKQAMYAAANRGIIRRGTWIGCALNAASKETLEDVCFKIEAASIQTAAYTFGLTERQVQIFITRWDKMTGTDEECTERLKEAILKAGLFIEPGEKLPRIIRKTVFESYESKMMKQFEALMEAEAVPNTVEAEFMLTGASA